MNFLLRLAGVMVLMSGTASGIGVSSVESFWGEMVGDCNATCFLAEDPEDKRDGVFKAGSGRGILWEIKLLLVKGVGSRGCSVSGQVGILRLVEIQWLNPWSVICSHSTTSLMAEASSGTGEVEEAGSKREGTGL